MKAKKMQGLLLCHSHAATAVCIPVNSRSAIVPRRFIDHNNHRRQTSAVERRMLVASKRENPTNISSNTHTSNNTLITSTYDDLFQVVVMRVAIHCQGCAGKVRKHISKMEGVTSFRIDVESKRVTVMGHISPMGVLQSLSKVKRAELWHG